MKALKEKIWESLSAVLPITLIVLILSIVLVPMDNGTAMMFIVGALFLIIGMGLFQLGADLSMMPLGEGLGSKISGIKKLPLIIAITFFLGVIITIAEPDLQVLANQVPAIPNMVLVWTIAIGVGFFLVVAILRILFKVPLSRLLLVSYVIVFALSFFTPNDFLSVAFDSGGVTTGPITVPFILAMGAGIASVRSDKDAADDSFGLVALCSVGPILAVMILGIFYNTDSASYTSVTVPVVETTRNVAGHFLHSIPEYMYEVALSVLPILLVFLILQLITKRYTRRQRNRMLMGFVYTFFGLVLFLTGVNIGFSPVGHLFGKGLADSSFKWLLIPLGMLIGYFIVKAEPAVQVLNKQIEDITDGAIPRSTMNICLSVGVAISVGLSMVRVLTGISIMWILIPGYIIALALTFIVPKIFVGIAFDSGGVCSGPMTTTFLLPLAIGASEAIGGNVMQDAFGVVAFVAMTPLIAVQLMGLVYMLKEKKSLSRAEPVAIASGITDFDDEIIDYEEEENHE